MKRALFVALALLIARSLAAQPPDRTKPPLPGPVKALRLSPVQRFDVSGIPVHLVEAHEVPVVQVLLVVRSGSASDPTGRAGLAAFTADLLDEGAGSRDALDLADAVDFLGARLTTSVSWDYSVVGLHVPVARLEAALPLMADVALRPRFPAEEVDRLRKQALTRFLQARAEPRQVAAAALARAVFGPDHRYGRPAEGTAEGLAAVTAEELRAFHAAHYRPANAALIVVGDVDKRVLPLLQNAFSGWRFPGAPASAPRLTAPPPTAARRIVLVDKPGAAQSVVRVGTVGPPRRMEGHHALHVMNTVLGGSFTSRLNDNLREQHGYAYGASSFFDERLVAGLFQAGADIQTPSTALGLAEMVKELERIRTPPAADEVERARNYLALGQAADFETVGQIAGKVAEQVVYGLPPDFYVQFVPAVLAVDGPAVAASAAQHVDPTRLAIVVVGDRKVVEEPLRALGLGPVEVLTVDDVLGAPPHME